MRAMVQFLFRNAVLLLSALLWTGSPALGQDLTDERSVNRQFPVTRGTTLEVENKYGAIKVITWEKDSVAVDVTVLLTESSASRMRKLKDDVSIRFGGTKDYIVVRSVFKSESGRIARELRSVTHTLTGSNQHVEINYRIRVPEYLDVALSNKFGDIYTDDLRGSLEIRLANGALKAGRLTGNSTLDLSFANGVVKSLGSCNLKLAYADLTVGNGGQLDIYSKSSELRADSVNVLKIDSRRDKLFFDQVEYLYGTGSFTEVTVYEFLRESDLFMKYGKLSLDHVVPSFSKIYIESDYTDVNIRFAEGSAFRLDILHHEKAVLKLPVSGISVEETFDGKDHFRTTGTVGEGRPEPGVTIDALQKCFINLSIK